jgi:hypothetical protein
MQDSRTDSDTCRDAAKKEALYSREMARFRRGGHRIKKGRVSDR